MKTPSESRHNAQNSENEHVWHYYVLWHGENEHLFAEEESRDVANRNKNRKYTFYGNSDVLVLYHSDNAPCRCTLSAYEATLFADALLNGHTQTHHFDLAELRMWVTPDLPLNWE